MTSARSPSVLDSDAATSQRAPDAILFRDTALRSPKRFVTGTHRTRAPSDTFKLVEPYLSSAGVTRMADVTGLDHVGIPTTLALRPNAHTIACSSGKGVTREQAYASGAMEALELHAAEIAEVPSFRAPYTDLVKRFDLPQEVDFPLTRNSLFTNDWPFPWTLGWDLVQQREIPVPTAMVGMSRSSMRASLGAFLVSSNGLGAGNSLLEAIASGLYEVVERDAVACHFYVAAHANRLMPVVPRAMLTSYALVAAVVERCDVADIDTVVYDCTVDTDVPTYVALVYDRTERGVGVTRGSGSHLDPAVALLRALTEALQARLNFIAGSRDDIFRSAFARVRADRGLTVEALRRVPEQAPLAAGRISRATSTLHGDVAELLGCVTAVGARHVVVFDLTPSGCPVHVVRVVVPGFEGYMHHAYSPGRRARTFQPTSRC